MRIITLLFIALPLFAAAQSGEKPGKLRFQSGFFTSKWEIGDNVTKQKAVGLHLERYSPKAATEFAFMQKSDRNAAIWNIIGTVGLLGSVFSSDDGKALGFASVGVVGYTGALVCAINSTKHRKRAIKIYNTAYGY